VYDLTASFTGSACSNGTSSVSGFGYFDSASKTLYSAVLNSGRTMAFIFVGTRP
jgi:hypothetical protein